MRLEVERYHFWRAIPREAQRRGEVFSVVQLPRWPSADAEQLQRWLRRCWPIWIRAQHLGEGSRAMGHGHTWHPVLRAISNISGHKLQTRWDQFALPQFVRGHQSRLSITTLDRRCAPFPEGLLRRLLASQNCFQGREAASKRGVTGTCVQAFTSNFCSTPRVQGKSFASSTWGPPKGARRGDRTSAASFGEGETPQNAGGQKASQLVAKVSCMEVQRSAGQPFHFKNHSNG